MIAHFFLISKSVDQNIWLSDIAYQPDPGESSHLSWFENQSIRNVPLQCFKCVVVK